LAILFIGDVILKKLLLLLTGMFILTGCSRYEKTQPGRSLVDAGNSAPAYAAAEAAPEGSLGFDGTYILYRRKEDSRPLAKLLFVILSDSEESCF